MSTSKLSKPKNGSLVPCSKLPQDICACLFAKIKFFNRIQSEAFEDLISSDASLAVCAPTGCGKTVLMELAIARLIIKSRSKGQAQIEALPPCSVVYIAPMKSLCSERLEDWSQRFGNLGLKCSQLTGDTNDQDIQSALKAPIIVATPEKWESVTRCLSIAFFDYIQLYLIDEIHMLSDESRGPTLEVLIARTKAANYSNRCNKTRFVAVSATCPNIEDVAEWLGTPDCPAVAFSFDKSYRPVPLEVIVLGYPCHSINSNAFKFDFNLNYRLNDLIQKYSEGKPTLVFCSTRRGSLQAAKIVSDSCQYTKTSLHSNQVRLMCNSLHNGELRAMVARGVGFHHAGLHPEDRKNIESLFIQGHLPVLFATSTLSVGVNLPAHLVIIKSTDCYQNGVVAPAPISQIIQMIGRAGRPQFDSSAKAIIMVKNQDKERFSKCLQGQQTIESCLHLNILEHLNSEINLRTVKCQKSALVWMKSTFLYVRLLKEPKRYCLKIEPGSMESVNGFLSNIVAQNFGCLERLELVQRPNSKLASNERGESFSITTLGSIMALKAIKFKTMESLLSLSSCESIHQLVSCVAGVEDLSGVVLRVEEKRFLNGLVSKVPYKLHIQKVKTAQDKIAVLIHATLAYIQINEFNFQQDVNQIFRIAPRVTSALVQILEYKKYYMSLKNGYLLLQSMRTRLWHNSKYVSKQVPRIGFSSAHQLAEAGFTTLDSIRNADPRSLEVVLNRHAPFGNNLVEYAKHVPKVRIELKQMVRGSSESSFEVTVVLENHLEVSNKSYSPNWHKLGVIVGSCQNTLLLEAKVSERVLVSNKSWSKQFVVPVGKSLIAHCISSSWCGVGDSTFIKGTDFVQTADSSNPWVLMPLPGSKSLKEKASVASQKSHVQSQGCKHTCKDKTTCGHACCKSGLVSQKLTGTQSSTAVFTQKVAVMDSQNDHLTINVASQRNQPITNSRIDVRNAEKEPDIEQKKISNSPNVISAQHKVASSLAVNKWSSPMEPAKSSGAASCINEKSSPVKKFSFKPIKPKGNFSCVSASKCETDVQTAKSFVCLNEKLIQSPVKRKSPFKGQASSAIFSASPSKRSLLSSRESTESEFKSDSSTNLVTESGYFTATADVYRSFQGVDDSSISYSPVECEVSMNCEGDHEISGQLERAIEDEILREEAEFLESMTEILSENCQGTAKNTALNVSAHQDQFEDDKSLIGQGNETKSQNTLKLLEAHAQEADTGTCSNPKQYITVEVNSKSDELASNSVLPNQNETDKNNGLRNSVLSDGLTSTASNSKCEDNVMTKKNQENQSLVDFLDKFIFRKPKQVQNEEASKKSENSVKQSETLRKNEISSVSSENERKGREESVDAFYFETLQGYLRGDYM